jgi:hypothetical protein
MGARTLCLLFALTLLPVIASAQTDGNRVTDEIQVYDGHLAPPGIFNLTWHQNFTPIGSTTPGFPEGLVSNHAYVGVPEWARGVTEWFELGLYMPLYSFTTNHGSSLNGFKIRTLFAVPNADKRRFFYGANFEFSFNAKQWDTRRFTSEIRPIIGWHLGNTDIIVNPILDNSYIGFSNLNLVPAERLAHKFTPKWTLGVEEYGDYGAIHSLNSFHDQAHQFYFIADRTVKGVDIEAGVGIGVTASTDKLRLKLILSRDLN